MDGEMGALVKVSVAVWAAMSYARFAAARLRPGAARLAALLPAVALLCALPFAFSTSTLRGTAGFFLAWLGSFKLLLLATGGRGPLDPSLRLSHFVCTAALPVKLRQHPPASASGKEKDQKGEAESPVRGPARILLSGAVIPAIIYAYQFKSSMSRYQLLALYTMHVYFSLDLLLAAVHTVVHDLLGMEMEPQVDRPYLASSLRDFWGRRWNLMVPSILRPSVFRPVRARLGSAAVGVLATFLVSGLMHELIFYYIMRSPPSGEVTAFFLLHGACAAAEGWWAARGVVAVAAPARRRRTPHAGLRRRDRVLALLPRHDQGRPRRDGAAGVPGHGRAHGAGGTAARRRHGSSRRVDHVTASEQCKF